jgi:hypothetical protein
VSRQQRRSVGEQASCSVELRQPRGRVWLEQVRMDVAVGEVSDKHPGAEDPRGRAGALSRAEVADGELDPAERDPLAVGDEAVANVGSAG